MYILAIIFAVYILAIIFAMHKATVLILVTAVYGNYMISVYRASPWGLPAERYY